MSREREITCIICPNGCTLKLSYDDKKKLEVGGALCNKGIEYAFNEMTNPVRNLTTTVRVRGGALPLVSVRSDRPIPRDKIAEGVRILRDIEVSAPVSFGQIILKDILGTGVDIVATREIDLSE